MHTSSFVTVQTVGVGRQLYLSFCGGHTHHTHVRADAQTSDCVVVGFAHAMKPLNVW